MVLRCFRSIGAMYDNRFISLLMATLRLAHLVSFESAAGSGTGIDLPAPLAAEIDPERTFGLRPGRAHFGQSEGLSSKLGMIRSGCAQVSNLAYTIPRSLARSSSIPSASRAAAITGIHCSVRVFCGAA